jgi:hypothetical protein
VERKKGKNAKEKERKRKVKEEILPKRLKLMQKMPK